jgi:hypothetical protein
MDAETSVAPDLESTATFLAALAAARHIAWPFDHWLLEDAVPPSIAEAVCALPFAPPIGARFDGRREANNSTRVFFSPANQARHEVCRRLADTFRDPRTIAALEALTAARLADARLRIEYCQDVDGFWLEPHLDIAVKRFTLLIYLSEDPALVDAGTDLYDAGDAHDPAGRSSYVRGGGLIFIPGRDTWHGFSPRPLRGVRKSLIVNYVAEDWRAVEELA